MLKESFIGRRPSHFSVNPFVKSFIISETFLWSAWNFVMPIFAIFISNTISGGSIETAATSYSAYLIVRVVCELVSGQALSRKKSLSTYFILAGMICISLAYLGFAFTSSILGVYIFYSLIGVGIGIASPARNTLFSTHLDKDKEPTEWGIHDASVFMGMALAAALGGFIANKYGFQLLFIISAIVNGLGMIPFLIYSEGKNKPSILTQIEEAVHSNTTNSTQER